MIDAVELDRVKGISSLDFLLVCFLLIKHLAYLSFLKMKAALSIETSVKTY
jgi:hypothetical protein